MSAVPLPGSVAICEASKYISHRLLRHIRVQYFSHISSVELEDLNTGRVDVIIRHDLGHQPGVKADLILAETWFPVCSPALLGGNHPLKGCEDLRHHTLLHRQFHEDWRNWLRTHGIEGIDTSSGPSYTDEQLVLELAIAGQGVALARRFEVHRDLEEGRLVQPFDCGLETGFAHYLLYPEGTADFQEIVQLREWLLSEAETSSKAA